MKLFRLQGMAEVHPGSPLPRSYRPGSSRVARHIWWGKRFSVGCIKKALRCQQALEARFLGAIAQDDVRCQFRPFCVLGLTCYPCTGCIYDAAYLSVAVTNGRAEFQRRGPIGVILAREGLSYAAPGMRTSENTHLLGHWANKGL